FVMILAILANFSLSIETNPCVYGKIDAILWSSKAKKNTSVTIFSGDNFYEFDFETEILSVGRRIKHIWPEVETPISGASEVNEFKQKTNYEEEIVFYKDPKYWVYPSREEYSEPQTLIRSGIIKFFGDENISHTGLVIKLFSEKPNSIYRVLYTSKNKTPHVCGAVEEKREGKYEIIVGDEKKVPSNESIFKTGCVSFVNAFGPVISAAIRPFQNGRFGVIANDIYLRIIFSKDDRSFEKMKSLRIKDVFKCRKKIILVLEVMVASLSVMLLIVLVYTFLIRPMQKKAETSESKSG
ncbi:hypothetical protein B4U79_17101, partial [Dinothrombium tinctorium]